MNGGKNAAVRAGTVSAVVAVAVAVAAFRFAPRSQDSSDMDVNLQPLKLPLQAPKVVIAKSARELRLYDGDLLLRRFKVVLGKHAEGHKEREGDKRTPEGAFYVCTRNGQSKFHKFMGLSYPGPDDAARGLKAKAISRAEHDAIVAAHRKRECPPWKTALGGEVGMHGGGTDRDWTAGCIALDDAAVDELWAALKMGDPVIVEP